MAERPVLSEELLSQARARARAAGPLPEEVRRRIAALWVMQGGDRPVQRLTLAEHVAAPSWWAVIYLVPELADHLAASERRVGKEASLLVADQLRGVSDLLRQGRVQEAVWFLLGADPKGPGSRGARQRLGAVLRTLDLGLVGTEVAAALYAKTFGLDDLACDLVSDGTLDASQAALAAQLAQGEPPSDAEASVGALVLYRELLPDDVHAVRVEPVATALGAADLDVVDHQSE